MKPTRITRKKKFSEDYRLTGKVVKKAILPTFCFAVLSTVAFEKAVFADSSLTQVSAKQAVTKYVNISSGTLNLRSGASSSASVVVALSKGTAVTVYSESGGWAKVKANGKDGYVSASFLSATNPSSSTTAAAAPTTTKYVNVSGGSLNLRSGASSSASVVATLSKGTAVTVYSESGGWAKVKANGKDGYVSASFLSAANPSSSTTPAAAQTTTKYVNVSSGSLNLRSGASSSASVVATLSKGTAVTVYSEANGWAKVKANGKDGYVSASFLSAANPSSSTTPAAAPTTTKYVNVSSGSLNLRSGASSSASVVATLSKGTAVTVYSEANGWAKVKANGKDGYVSASFLSAANPSSTTTPVAAQTTTKYVNISSGSLNMRNGASTSASITVKLAKGIAVQVLSEAGGWSKITVYGKTGYVNSSFLSPTDPKVTVNNSTPTANPSVAKYVNITSGSSLNVRKSASTSSAILTKLTHGTEVMVYSESNGWAEILVNGQKGYVSAQFLTASKPTTGTTSGAEQTTKKYVNVSVGSSLNMRKSASSDASILLKLSRGVEVTVYSVSNGWAKIKVYEQTGYVSADFLSDTKPTPGTDSTTGSESNSDSGANTNPDSSSDLAGSTNPDNSSDATSSTKPDSSSDSTSSTNPDSSSDSTSGTNPDSSSDSTSGTNPDSSSDSTSGTNPDSSSDSATSTNPDSSSDSTSSTSPDSSSEQINGEKVVKYVDVIYGSSLNMRASASANAAIITKLARGTVVTVLSEDNGWAKVTANGLTGYVSTRYLSVTAPFNPNTTASSTEVTYENYTTSLADMVKTEMAVHPQTDKKYNTFIREDALKVTSSTAAIVNGGSWNVRGGAGTNYWVIGQVTNQQSVQLLNKVKGSDGYNWYQIAYDKTWVNASPDDVSYYLDPKNFQGKTIDSLQFLKLSVTASLNADEVNARILTGKGILVGLASTFISAGTKYGINEMYLISHALLETSNGTSQLANGVQINGKTVYNMYGIGAYDNSAVTSGAQFAYNAGWFTPEAAIIGGAQFIANGYINAGQDTLYKMRWNPKAVATTGNASHQYATDIGWAAKQVSQIYNLYNLIDSYKLVLEIPKYN
ncbi:SH3 domain-containing protein [Neobacillus drentensis]|uniref:SH3 domain-containing protein n=1 Tax=Neobacillus drentensis TaxID=220684 RepID=UPI001F3074A8|nr:SH3 domain-containing protein [Neobacillus drentensis]ULT54389.1 SH3 domain-containing protein [Neobacillus drentensis]